MTRATAGTLVLVSVLCLAACSGEDDGAAAPHDEPIVLLTKLTVAAASGADTIATGDVMQGSSLAGSAFCAGGTILDVHAEDDPSLELEALVSRTITCPDGTVKLGLTPDVGSSQDAQGSQTQTGSWTIAGGTGAFEGLHGRGEMKVVYGPDDDSPVRETLTGTVTR